MSAPNLPQSLLLLALHDEKGTVHPSAFLSIDHGLRGAVLAELRIRGRAQTHMGRIRLTEGEDVDDDPLLAKALGILQEQPSPAPIESYLGALEGMDDLRSMVRAPLVAAGILQEQEVDRHLELADGQNFPMVDNSAEQQIVEEMQQGVDAGESLDRRVGTLLGLVHATNLIKVAVPSAQRRPARTLAKWILKHDSIPKAVEIAVAKAQGTWEG